MKERNICNMITSIISATIIIPLLVLGILFTDSTLSMIFLCIYYPILLAHYILKSIFYAKEESISKEVLYRISNSFLDIATALITISFSFVLPNPYKWIVMGFVCAIGLAEVLLDSFHKLELARWILTAIKGFLFLFIIIAKYKINFIVELGLFSPLIAYTSNLLGKEMNNKIILSMDMVAVVLYGIFIIFL